MRKRSLVPQPDAEIDALTANGSDRALRVLRLGYAQLRTAYETECAVADAALQAAGAFVELLIRFAHKHGVDSEPEAAQMRAAIVTLENLK